MDPGITVKLQCWLRWILDTVGKFRKAVIPQSIWCPLQKTIRFSPWSLQTSSDLQKSCTFLIVALVCHVCFLQVKLECNHWNHSNTDTLLEVNRMCTLGYSYIRHWPRLSWISCGFLQRNWSKLGKGILMRNNNPLNFAPPENKLILLKSCWYGVLFRD